MIHTGLALLAFTDAILHLRGKGTALNANPLQAVVNGLAIICSLLSLFLTVRGSVNICLFLYPPLACVVWAIAWTSLSPSCDMALYMSGMYLLASIATLSVPYDVPYGASHPLVKVPLLPALTLSWLDSLIKQATTAKLSPESLWQVKGSLSAYELTLQKIRLEGGITQTILRRFPGRFCYSVLLGLINLAITFAQPFLIKSLLQNREPVTVGILFIANLVIGTTQAHLTYSQQIVGVMLRGTLTLHVCKRGLFTAQRKTIDAPDPFVLLDVDLPRMYDFIEQMHSIWMVPLQSCISVGALIYILGWRSILVGSISPVSISDTTTPRHQKTRTDYISWTGHDIPYSDACDEKNLCVNISGHGSKRCPHCTCDRGHQAS